jgi:hypothetical protein
LLFSLILSLVNAILHSLEPSKDVRHNGWKHFSNIKGIKPQGKPWTLWAYEASLEVLNLLKSSLARKWKCSFISLTLLDYNLGWQKSRSRICFFLWHNFIFHDIIQSIKSPHQAKHQSNVFALSCFDKNQT